MGLAPDMFRKVKDIIGDYNISYEYNGNSVFIYFKKRGTGAHYSAKAKICVLEKGGKEPVCFYIYEGVIDNLYGGIHTCVGFCGIPKKMIEGFYPYGTFFPEEEGVFDTDIMERAEKILENYDIEHPDQKSLAELFRSYVPASYEEIKAQLFEQAGKKVENFKDVSVNKSAQATKVSSFKEYY